MSPPEPKDGDVQITVRFSCEAAGFPTPVIRWIHNGQKVINVPNAKKYKIQNNDEYVIVGVTHVDRGIVQCVAENEAGVITAAATLKVKDCKSHFVFISF